MRFGVIAFLVIATLMWCSDVTGQDTKAETAHGDELLSEYFRMQTRDVTDNCFAGIETLEDWTTWRDEYRQQLFEMLGIDPTVERTALNATVTGTVESEEFIVENIHFQSRPGLYVTGNLYRPKKVDQPLPAILYVCGHGRVKIDGVSYGNKTHYQHHGAWFARNGYVCLTIDTIQLGEIEGVHHGTYREGRWWWNGRGYTPAGVEAWNCIRALDYLQSRDEVDGDRLGVTGRSGGGAYSWWVAALDERIKAAVPVAGITSMTNHVVDGCVSGHCDCMYMLNSYRWDFPMVAALVAPRPLLITNTDKDRIFPLDGVVDVYFKTRKIYELYGATDKLALQISEGPHKDTQELRVAAFHWLNRYLKNDETLIEKTATKFFEPQELKAFPVDLPSDEIVTTIDEQFVVQEGSRWADVATDSVKLQEARKMFREKCFSGWPAADKADALDVELIETNPRDGLSISEYRFTSQKPYRLPIYLVHTGPTVPQDLFVVTSNVVAMGQSDWERFEDVFSGKASDETWNTFKDKYRKLLDAPSTFVVPRGVGSTRWNQDTKANTHIERRFMLLGQTSEAMQTYDLVRAMAAVETLAPKATHQFRLHGGEEGINWIRQAALLSDNVSSINVPDEPIEFEILNWRRYFGAEAINAMLTAKLKQTDDN